MSRCELKLYDGVLEIAADWLSDGHSHRMLQRTFDLLVVSYRAFSEPRRPAALSALRAQSSTGLAEQRPEPIDLELDLASKADEVLTVVVEWILERHRPSSADASPGCVNPWPQCSEAVAP